MAPDDDDGDDSAASGPPLPPDDRLWRHPSEVARHGPPTGAAVAPAHIVVTQARWPVAVVAGSLGAVLAIATLAATGGLTHEVERPVVQKVAVTPVVSSPMVQGERGVAAVAAKVAPAVAVLTSRRSSSTSAGSAVIFRDDGLLLTSAHLVGDATNVDVTLASGHTYEGRVVGVDPTTDVAVVDIGGDDLPVAVLGQSTDLEVGAPTIALTAARRSAPAVATGVISALSRRVETVAGTLHGMIQTDAPVEAAGVGGPVLDSRGAVIGITGAMPIQGTYYGFAIPIDLAQRIADELVGSGHVSHPWLGIEGTDLSDADASDMGVGGGARIDRVSPAGPADAAGLVRDDVITEVDGHHVDSSSALVTAVRAHQPGDDVLVGYWHDGVHQQCQVTVGDKPAG